jgi:hypothetical protein
MATLPFYFPSTEGNAPAGLPEALAIFAQRRAQQMPSQQPAQLPQVAGGGFWNSPGAPIPFPSLAQPQQAPQQQAMAYGAEPPKPPMPAAVGAMPPAAAAGAPAGASAQGGNWWQDFARSGGGDFLGNALTDLGAGLVQGRDFGEGLGLATQRTAQLGPERQQMRAGQAERNQTAEWLKSKYPDLANLPPELGFKLAIQREQESASGGGKSPSFFGTPIWGVGPDGQPAFGQLNNQGQFQVTETPDGFQFGKDPIKLDAGTHHVLLDPVTRQQIGVIPKDNFGAARATAAGGVAGKSEAQGVVDAPAAIAGAQNSIAQIDAVINDPNLDWAVGAAGVVPALPGTPQAGTVARIEQLQGAAFLQAFETLKGGGQITEIEGKKATDAIARLSRAQNKTDFVQALNDLKGVIQTGLDRARQKGSGAAGGAPSAADPLGMR